MARIVVTGGAGFHGPLRCAFVGDQSLAARCAALAIDHGLDVAVIASRHEEVLQFARDRGIPGIDTRQAADLAAALAAHRFDVLLSVAYLEVLPPAVLDQASVAINFHDGPLPGYAGLNVTTWALWNGEDQHAVTWHLMTSQVDRGDVIATAPVPIAPDETALSLNARCYQAAAESFASVAAALAAGELVARPQPAEGRRTYLRRHRPIVVVDPLVPAATIERAVRALAVGRRVANAVGEVRLVVGDEVVVVAAASTLPTTAGPRPGRIISIDGSGLRAVTVEGDLVLTELRATDGSTLDIDDLARRHGLVPGGELPAVPAGLVGSLTELDPALASAERWWSGRLAHLEPTTPALLTDQKPTSWKDVPLDLPGTVTTEQLQAGVAVWLAGLASLDTATFACTDARSRDVSRRLGPLVQPGLVAVPVPPEATFGVVCAEGRSELEGALAKGPFLADLVGRTPELRERDLTSLVALDLDVAPGEVAPDGGLLRLVQLTDGAVRLRSRLPDSLTARIVDQLEAVLAAGVADPERGVAALPLIGALDRGLLDRLNDTAVDHDRDVTVDELFRRQVAATPDAPAVTSGGTTLTYAQLAVAADHLAATLGHAGVQPGDVVGIALERGIGMVTAVLAVLTRGAAYLPLDPGYPEDRIRFMVQDSHARVLIARPATAQRLADPSVIVVPPPPPETAGGPSVTDGRGRGEHGASDLAYLIYTSGSTGLPKGVELRHGNVTNFFVGMDAVIEHDPPGVWLAVTSLSFDISVLELLWTLTRGFHVVVKRESGFRPAQPERGPAASRSLTMSLFYFSAGEEQAGDGYRLLLDGARWADANGFEAVWTPERHFHPFGAAYPNPSVVSAAIAAATRSIAIRAGSIVLPLHSPVRVAEEWAVVDNLSHGRVGISFAPGWQRNDFVLNPSAYAGSREALPGLIDTVQRLWRGETVTLPGPDHQPVAVRTQPRPVQAELPVWLTSAGTPATFEQAGRLGVNVLTHLLGQSVDQLRENIARYRQAWATAGHPGEGRVTLMLHSFLDEDASRARDRARLPLKGYLSTAVGLLKDLASSFPTFARAGADADEAFRALSEDELSQLLDMATDRYLTGSGLIGDVDEAVALVSSLSDVGVDEIACLIDFGIDTDTVLGSLDLLGEVHRRVSLPRPTASTAAPADAGSDSVAELVRRHGVTHLQCTPSLAAMLVADPVERDSLRSIRHLMLGGEALPPALAGSLRQLLTGRLTNMYGPTETTIWSLTHEIDRDWTATVPIGTAIANTTLFVLDRHGRPLPVGAFGELHIGGEGVAGRYRDRPELTAARFVDRPGMGRVYATGDVVRVTESGWVEFGGRSDDQLKIRGHRVELGEIEAVLDAHPAVVRSVVVARGEQSPVLVGFVVVEGGGPVTPDQLREHAAARLPEAMVPSAVAVLDALPLTPNGKIDRNRLPQDVTVAPSAGAAPVAPPADGTERLVAELWSAELGRPVGRNEHFFEIGGHSLLAVKLFRALAEATGAPIALTDIFRYPTVRTFAAHLATLGRTDLPAVAGGGGPAGQGSASPAPSERGALRRRSLGQRAARQVSS